MVLAPLLPPFILEWCCFVHHHAAPCIPPYVTRGAPDPDSGAPLSWGSGQQSPGLLQGPGCLPCPCWLLSLLGLGWGHRHCAEPWGSLSGPAVGAGIVADVPVLSAGVARRSCLLWMSSLIAASPPRSST